MSTTLLIPLVGVFCIAVAALLLSPQVCRRQNAGIITAVRAVGDRGADYREIELDVMAYDRSDDESSVAVCVPPS